MAACTYTARILVSLRLLVPSQILIDMSLGPAAGGTEYTARTTEVAGIAADTYESRMGSAGAFDDTDRTVGDRRALSWGVTYAKHLLFGSYNIRQPETHDAEETRLMQLLETYAEGAVQEASIPVLTDVEDE